MPDYKTKQVTPPALGPTRYGAHSARFNPGEKAKDARGTFKKLISFYLREAKSLFVVLVLLLINTSIIVFVPYLIGSGVNVLSTNTGESTHTVPLYFYPLILLIAYIADGGLNITQGIIMNRVSQRIVRSLRKSLFHKLQNLPLTYHDTHSHGDLMSRLTNDVDNISSTIAQSTTQLVSAILTMAGTLIMMLLLSIHLTIASLITIPLVILLSKCIAARSVKMFIGQQQELGSLNGIIEESITGQKMIKAFDRQEIITSQFAETNQSLRFYSIRAQIWAGFLMPFMNVITNLGYVVIAFTGGMLVVQQLVTIGIVTSFLTYARQFTFPMNNIASMFNNLQAALAGAERVFRTLEEQEELADMEDAIDIGIPKGEVEFRNVTFAYEEGQDVLKNVNFSVKAGQKVALIGPTGAGKTTIVNLLTRFYDASEGQVCIDGRDIRDYKRESLSRAFSVVLQDTCLFTGTIADNIRYGRAQASDEEVMEAARIAGAHNFIQRLKDGYQTLVKGDSETLSQGQRQLLAISRAALVHAPILILDEATSSVDTRTELKIQQALLNLTRGATSFVIAHRLSTIRDADMIMVVQDGRIVESGAHEELLHRDGVYAKMYYSQFEGF